MALSMTDMIQLPSGKWVDGDLSTYKMANSQVRCDVHGKHCVSVFHYPSEFDRNTYYACLLCIQEATGFELVKHDGVIKW